jgi:nucleoside-diphosphate-sugar epimerase
MPAVTNNSKVLLTGMSLLLSTRYIFSVQLSLTVIIVLGANGFVGAWVLKYLLEEGFNVRAAVRTQAKADYLKNLFIQYSNDSQLEFVLVEDITTPGAFDEAVKNVDAIIHTASPLSNPDPKADPQVTIAPAVDGTLGILKSAKKEPLIKRVVLTSSISTVFEPRPTVCIFNEVSVIP